MRYRTYEWAYKHSKWVQPHAYVFFYFIKMSLYFFHLSHGLHSIFNFYTVTAVTLTNWMNFVNSWLTSVTGLPWWLFVLFEFWMVVNWSWAGGVQRNGHVGGHTTGCRFQCQCRRLWCDQHPSILAGGKETATYPEHCRTKIFGTNSNFCSLREGFFSKTGYIVSVVGLRWNPTKSRSWHF